MEKLYLIGGPMGVGKTSACGYLKQLLPKSVFLDGDWCWDANPFQVTEETKAMVMDNICHLLNNFIRCTAYEHVIFCWVMDRQEILDEVIRRIRPALDDSQTQLFCVTLSVTPQVLRQRLHKTAQTVRRRCWICLSLPGDASSSTVRWALARPLSARS